MKCPAAGAKRGLPDTIKAPTCITTPASHRDELHSSQNGLAQEGGRRNRKTMQGTINKTVCHPFGSKKKYAPASKRTQPVNANAVLPFTGSMKPNIPQIREKSGGMYQIIGSSGSRPWPISKKTGSIICSRQNAAKAFIGRMRSLSFMPPPPLPLNAQ